jgi:HD-GYP domain-containing protein (c-di-GMP phosphodiesterase class II)
VRHHHERLDGRYYPDGLRGDEISLDARIIAVADVYYALTSARPYCDAYPSDVALTIIDRDAGTKLDSLVVQSLHRVVIEWRPASSPAVFTPAYAD